MKHLRFIAVLTLMPLFTMCMFQGGERKDKEYSVSELLGKWNRDNPKKSPTEENHEIEFIQLVNDSIAELGIKDSTGERVIKGTWNNHFKKEIGSTGMAIESDIRLTYYIDDHHSHMLLLNIHEKNDHLFMSVGDYNFQKE